MSELVRFDAWRQRAALVSLIDVPGFLSTAEGFAFIEQIQHFHARGMVALARKEGFSLDTDEVVNTMLENLLQYEGRVAGYAAASEGEPWAYLSTCTVGWVRKLWGWRGASLEVLEYLPEPYYSEPDSPFTPLEDVVALTFQLLAPLTAERLHGELFKLLGWLAANPPQRLSYEKFEAQAAHRFCPSFTIGQVTAVMNIAYGGRPRNAETSIMGAFLLDANFTFSEGSTQAVALETYKRRMIAERRGSRSLADWN